MVMIFKIILYLVNLDENIIMIDDEYAGGIFEAYVICILTDMVK
jgi:hypothetical protein